MRQRWVFTSQPFLPVDTQSVINNRIWNEDQFSELPVGQLPLAEANYVQDARWELPAAVRGGHMCHPEWFATGEPWPNDLPPTVYEEGWIPICCGATFAHVGGDGDPGGPGVIVYEPRQFVSGEGSPMGRVQYVAHPPALASGSGGPAVIATLRAAPAPLVSGEGEPVLYLWNDTYTGTCAGDNFTLTGPASLSDLRWIGTGSTSAKPWIFIYKRATTAWRLDRRKNGLPTFYTWIVIPSAWDRRGTSPAFAKSPPVQAGSPACTPPLTAAGNEVFTH